VKDSEKMIAVPAWAQAAGQGNRPLEARQWREALTGSDSPAPQLDRLTEKFEAELSAALRPDASAPAPSMPPSSVDESSGAGQLPARPPSQEIVSGGAHSNDHSFGILLEADQLADPEDVRIQGSPPELKLDPALRPLRLALLVPQSQKEPDGSSPPLVAHDVHPSDDAEEDSLGQPPENLPSEDWELQTKSLPHQTAEILPQDQEHCEEQSRSTEPANFDDPIDPREDMSPQPGAIAHWLRRWESSLTRRGAIPVAILAASACIGAILLLPVLAPGSLPTENESDGGATSNASAIGVAEREPTEHKWTMAADSMDQESAVHVPQEPITPKRVKTVRISGSSEQADDALQRPELPSFGPLDGMLPEQTGKSALVGTDAQRSNKDQVRTESSGAGLSESAVGNANPAERVEVEEGGPAPIDEALTESEPQVAEAVRWPNAIRSEDGAQTGDRIAAAGSTDESDLPHGDPALRGTPGTTAAPELAPAETEDSPFSASVGGSRPAEPTRFAPVTTDVNMRAESANDARVITVVPAGARVGVIDCATWCEVVFEGKRGWVHRSLVTGASGSGGVHSGPADRQIAAGTPLISADGAQIGIIRGLSTDAAGQDFVIVDLTHELGAATSSIRLRAEYIAAADGQARINVTRARLVSSLPTQSSAEASTATGAN
jgi:hypothetical protein